MSRLYALMATADGMGGAILRNLPRVVYRNGGDQDPDPERGRRFIYTRGEEDYELLLLPVAQAVPMPVLSAATSGAWDIWLLVADSRDVQFGTWRWAAAAQRWLRRHGSAGYTLGPYSIAHALERWPVHIEPLLKNDDAKWSFPLLQGDSHDMVTAIDYRPSQDEIDTDADPDPDLLFGE